MSFTPVVRRWAAFNLVGAGGLALQLATLASLIEVAQVHYLAATIAAVEAAVLHNFIWHQWWTWRDRPSAAPGETAQRLLRFHLTNGAISIVGNVIMMAGLTGALGVAPVPANVLAIAACSLVNFAASEWVVFSGPPVSVSGRS